MIFLTVGTQFPFDRLVKAVDKAVDKGLIDGEIFAQIGKTSYRPRNFESVSFLDKQVFDERLRDASSVISHAGMGTITSVLENNKPLLVMPRLKKHGEVVNNHQVIIAKMLTQLGYALVAHKTEDLIKNIRKLGSFTPSKRHNDPSPVVARVWEFLDELRAA